MPARVGVSAGMFQHTGVGTVFDRHLASLSTEDDLAHRLLTREPQTCEECVTFAGERNQGFSGVSARSGVVPRLAQLSLIGVRGGRYACSAHRAAPATQENQGASPIVGNTREDVVALRSSSTKAWGGSLRQVVNVHLEQPEVRLPEVAVWRPLAGFQWAQPEVVTPGLRTMCSPAGYC